MIWDTVGKILKGLKVETNLARNTDQMIQCFLICQRGSRGVDSSWWDVITMPL
jgi:hypothetical protein